MTWDGYKEEKKYPPEWYSKLEDWVIDNRFVFLFILYILIFFVWPFFDEPDRVDPELIELNKLIESFNE